MPRRQQLSGARIYATWSPSLKTGNSRYNDYQRRIACTSVRPREGNIANLNKVFQETGFAPRAFRSTTISSATGHTPAQRYSGPSFAGGRPAGGRNVVGTTHCGGCVKAARNYFDSVSSMGPPRRPEPISATDNRATPSNAIEAKPAADAPAPKRPETTASGIPQLRTDGLTRDEGSLLKATRKAFGLRSSEKTIAGIVVDNQTGRIYPVQSGTDGGPFGGTQRGGIPEDGEKVFRQVLHTKGTS